MMSCMLATARLVDDCDQTSRESGGGSPLPELVGRTGARRGMAASLGAESVEAWEEPAWLLELGREGRERGGVGPPGTPGAITRQSPTSVGIGPCWHPSLRARPRPVGPCANRGPSPREPRAPSGSVTRQSSALCRDRATAVLPCSATAPAGHTDPLATAPVGLPPTSPALRPRLMALLRPGVRCAWTSAIISVSCPVGGPLCLPRGVGTPPPHLRYVSVKL